MPSSDVWRHSECNFITDLTVFLLLLKISAMFNNSVWELDMYLFIILSIGNNVKKSIFASQ